MNLVTRMIPSLLVSMMKIAPGDEHLYLISIYVPGHMHVVPGFVDYALRQHFSYYRTEVIVNSVSSRCVHLVVQVSTRHPVPNEILRLIEHSILMEGVNDQKEREARKQSTQERQSRPNAEILHQLMTMLTDNVYPTVVPEEASQEEFDHYIGEILRPRL